jgi:hypothetical protein
MIQLCRHILRNNRQCGEPALHNTLFCRHHRDVKDWKRRSGLRSQIRTQTPTQTYDHGTILVPDRNSQVYPPVDLEFPEDPAAILTNIYRVNTLLLQGHIDRPTANSVTYGMQVCLSALNGKSLFGPAASAKPRSNDTDPDSETTYSDPGCPTTGRSDLGSRPVHRVILTPDGDEIAPPLQILEDNEAEPIHHKGCPCLLCAEKYRNHPPELHHANCQCGLCEEQDEGTGTREQGSEQDHGESNPLRDESKDMDTSTNKGAPSLANRGPQHARCSRDGVGKPKVGKNNAEPADLFSDPCSRIPDSDGAPFKPGVGLSGIASCRIARASTLLSNSTNRDPLNRPWSVAEYTFGDAIRRHEAQYAARAAAALAAGIEPPPYEPFATGLIPAGTPEYEEDQQMQQHSSEYWAAHFRKLIAERPDIQQYLDEEADNDPTTDN